MSLRLSERYLRAIYQLPPELRVRKPLEEKAMGMLEEGKHVCIRGFWRIGKTELMRAALGGVCGKLKTNGLYFDLRIEGKENFLPQSADEVLAKIVNQLDRFYGKIGCSHIIIDQDSPLDSLGEVDGRLFLGIDEMIAMGSLGKRDMEKLIREIKGIPGNVNLVLVCHRHLSVDDTFEKEIVNDPDFATIVIPPITARELEYIVQTPAKEAGAAFSDGALGKLSELSGDKPWEVFVFCHMIANMLEAQELLKPGLVIGKNHVEDTITLPNVMADGEGRWVAENYARIFLSAMNAMEKSVMRLVALGSFSESEKHVKTLEGLKEAGWVENNGPLRIKSSLFERFIKGVTSGGIKVGKSKGF